MTRTKKINSFAQVLGISILLLSSVSVVGKIRKVQECGVLTWMSGEDPACGPLLYNKKSSSACPPAQCKTVTSKQYCGDTKHVKKIYLASILGNGLIQIDKKTWWTPKTCVSCAAGVITYHSCRNKAHGVEKFKSCPMKKFGVKEYKSCEIIKTREEINDFLRESNEIIPLFRYTMLVLKNSFVKQSRSRTGLACLIRSHENSKNKKVQKTIKGMIDDYQEIFDIRYSRNYALGCDDNDKMFLDGLQNMRCKDMSVLQCSQLIAIKKLKSKIQKIYNTSNDLISDIVARRDPAIKDLLTKAFESSKKIIDRYEELY